MSHRITIRLTDTQKKIIKKHNVSQSEFIRRAVDFYILHLSDPYTHTLLLELKNWIDTKSDDTKTMTSIHQNDDDCHTYDDNMTSKSRHHDIETMTTNIEKQQLQQTKRNFQTENPLAQMFHNELRTLHNLIVNPEGDHTVPDYTIKLLSKRYDVSKSVINAWIADNYEWLKEGNFEDV